MFMARVLRAAMMALILSLATTFMALTAAITVRAYCSEILCFPSAHDTPNLFPRGDKYLWSYSLQSYWENNTLGVTGKPGGAGGCIPIDGGLGFLIAGGLSIGVIGIRRRKEELELERG